MTKRLAFIVALALVALGLPGAVAQTEPAQEAAELHIATLAPSGSSWMRVFDAWNLTIQKQTNKTLKLRFYPGGSRGDERDFVRQMRAAELDGAALTTTGLGRVLRPVFVLGLPGIIVDYDQLDRVRAALNRRFERMFDEEGYVVLGWGDVGNARLFSTERIERPSDIKKLRPWLWKGDPIFAELLKIVGANPVRLGLPGVYPALQKGTVDTVPASAIAAVSLQWYTRLKFVSKRSSGIIVGATLVRKEALEALTDEQVEILVKTGARAHRALVRMIRRDDEKSYQAMLSRGIAEVDTTEFESEWTKLEKEIRQRLTDRVYPKSLLDEVIAATEPTE